MERQRGTGLHYRREPPRKKASTFSHSMLFAVMITYFYGLLLGTGIIFYIITNYPEYALQAYLGMLTYIGAPVGVAIGFYMWKSKNENVLKIKESGGEVHDE